MRGTVGAWTVAVGVLHEVIGIMVGAPHLLDIVGAGVFNTVTDDRPWRMAIFWFEAWGLLLMLLGFTWHQMECRGLPVSRGMALGLVAVGVVGVICMPVSGFWTVFALAALAWSRAGQRPGQLGEGATTVGTGLVEGPGSL